VADSPTAVMATTVIRRDHVVKLKYSAPLHELGS